MLFTKYRNLNGIFLIDKPYGLSSNSVLKIIKRILKINKIGHTGSLDPCATGMLPICCGRATKLSQFLINSNKRYHVIAKLGQQTSTSDSEGEIIKVKSINFTIDKLLYVLRKFHGTIQQTPSMYSAIKYKGKELYKYARKGIVILRQSRKVYIYQLKLLGYKSKFLELDIICSKGTYIRTLIEDLGEKLGCCAHVISLRRLQVGNYSYSKMINLSELNTLEKYNINGLNKIFISMDDFSLCFPEVNITSQISKYLKYRQSVNIKSSIKNQFVRITEGLSKKFIGIGKINYNNNELFPFHLIL